MPDLPFFTKSSITVGELNRILPLRSMKIFCIDMFFIVLPLSYNGADHQVWHPFSIIL